MADDLASALLRNALTLGGSQQAPHQPLANALARGDQYSDAYTSAIEQAKALGQPREPAQWVKDNPLFADFLRSALTGLGAMRPGGGLPPAIRAPRLAGAELLAKQPGVRSADEIAQSIAKPWPPLERPTENRNIPPLYDLPSGRDLPGYGQRSPEQFPGGSASMTGWATDWQPGSKMLTGMPLRQLNDALALYRREIERAFAEGKPAPQRRLMLEKLEGELQRRRGQYSVVQPDLEPMP